MVRFFLLILITGFSLTTYSQEKLRIANGDLVVKNPGQENENIWLYKNDKGQSKLIQKQTTIESDSTKFIEVRNYAEAKGNVYINQNDSVDIYSNEAFYYGNTRRTILKGEVALIKDFYTLQTEKLNYDLVTQIATYNTGGELTDTTSTLTSKIGTFYVDKDEAVFKDSVVLVTPDRRIETEKLTYILNEKWAYFEGETTIYEGGQVIKTTKGKYNTETGEALIEGDPEIDNEETYAKADRFELTDEDGIGRAIGNVYFNDKTNNSELYADEVEQLTKEEIFAKGNVDITNWEDSINLKANQAKINETKEEFFATGDVIVTVLNQDTKLLTDTLEAYQAQGISKAYGRPFLSTMNEGDSVFLVAKQMETVQKIGEDADTIYDFMANKHVMLYKSDLQAVADSAYVNSRDSIITLFHDPIIWSDSTQMSADTIRIFLKNQTIEKVEFRKNCFFANLVEDGLYNQLKGREMDAYFIDGVVDSLHTNGNAETIFMVQDDFGAYVAIDKMKSGKMNVSFLEGAMDQVYWYNQQSGTTYPFQEIDPAEFKLTGFAWREDEKPTSKDDLLIAIGRKEGEFKFKERTIDRKPPDVLSSPGGGKLKAPLEKGNEKNKRPETPDAAPILKGGGGLKKAD